MSANGSGSPVEYPKVAIGGEVLTVKIGLLAELILSRAGLTFQDVIKGLLPNTNDPKKFDFTMQFFAAAVAHNYPSGQAPTADQWAEKIDALGGTPELNSPLLVRIYTGLSEAIVKRWPSPRPVQETAAKQPDTTEPLQ
jgi:hypothetical protein